MPTRPATAPESSIVMRTIRLTLTPLATAADSDWPGGPQVEAEPRPAEQEPVGDADDDRDDDEAVDLLRRSPLRRGTGEPGHWPDGGIGLVLTLLDALDGLREPDRA